ncbi:hypothetical protein BCR33DRAFT_769104 [Rhizoclosmatium globosum]|uniref:Uncharacterized protein n=1 Tax=Rhizoclosmatium globosum TaxID=329046 RepID=A0A1Y2BWX4_9FUNG|nr:hypothetical protein BCR33DRAFT_769104 [Rhizoclosmatium globosum]|eukprot:ORY38615.1 hypothetical protein BCR33DRAFT_769104 [Rhizoclosmatium globosum]
MSETQTVSRPHSHNLKQLLSRPPPSTDAIVQFANERRRRLCVSIVKGWRCEATDCHATHAKHIAADYQSPAHKTGSHEGCGHLYAQKYALFLDCFLFSPAVALGLVRRSFADAMLEKYASPSPESEARFIMNPIGVLDTLNASLSNSVLSKGLNLKDVVRWGLSMRQVSSLEDYFFKVYAFMLLPSDSERTSAKVEECCKTSSFICHHVHFKVNSRERVYALRWIIKIILSALPDINADDINVVTSRLEKFALPESDIHSSTLASLISQLASLALIYKSETQSWAKSAIVNFGMGVSFSATQEAHSIDFELDISNSDIEATIIGFLSDLDSHRLLQASLNPSTKNIEKLRVCTYTVGVGKEFAKPLLQLFQSAVKINTNHGETLPPSIPYKKYESILSLNDPSEAHNHYTMPMHMYLLKETLFTTLAQSLHNMKVSTFASPSNTTKIKKWAHLAVEKIVEKNSIWSAWRVPTQADLLTSCDALMKHWVSVFTPLVVLFSPQRKTQRPSTSQEEAGCNSRWLGEPEISVLEKYESTDWRQICRQLRDEEWKKPGGGNLKTGSLLTYLYYASNCLKHTQYDTVDPVAFLHSARELFEIFAKYEWSAGVDVKEQFNGLVNEIWSVLPGTERDSWVADLLKRKMEDEATLGFEKLQIGK